MGLRERWKHHPEVANIVEMVERVKRVGPIQPNAWAEVPPLGEEEEDAHAATQAISEVVAKELFKKRYEDLNTLECHIAYVVTGVIIELVQESDDVDDDQYRKGGACE